MSVVPSGCAEEPITLPPAPSMNLVAVTLQGMAEGIVGRDEVPGGATGLGDGLPRSASPAHRCRKLKWKLIGEQALPVKSDEPGPLMTKILLFCFATSRMAKPADDAAPSAIMSTFSVSNQLRAVASSDVRLVLVIGGDHLDLLAENSPPKSSAASLAAATEPTPPLSANTPDWSFSTPILMVSAAFADLRRRTSSAAG